MEAGEGQKARQARSSLDLSRQWVNIDGPPGTSDLTHLRPEGGGGAGSQPGPSSAPGPSPRGQCRSSLGVRALSNYRGCRQPWP